MNILVLFLTLLAMLIISLLLCDWDLLSPGPVSCLLFSVSCGILIPNLSTYNLNISIDTVLVVAVGVAAVVLGDCVARHIRPLRRQKNYESKEKSEWRGYFRFSDTLLLLVSLLFLLVALLSYRYVQSQVGASLSSDQTLLGAYRSEGESSGLLQYLTQFCMAVTYVITLSVILDWHTGHKIHKLKFVPIFLYLLIVVLSAARIQIVYFAAFAIVCLYLVWRQDNQVPKQASINLVKYGIPFFLLFLIGFYALGFLTGKSDAFSLWQIVSVYVGSPIISLDYYLQFAHPSPFVSGFETLYGLSDLLNAFGYDVADRTLEFAPFIPIEGLYANTYTCFRRLIHDYGIGGMLLIRFLEGFVFLRLYQLSISRLKTGAPATAVIFSFLYSTFFLQSIDEFVIVINVTKTALVSIFVIWFITKIFYKRLESKTSMKGEQNEGNYFSRRKRNASVSAYAGYQQAAAAYIRQTHDLLPVEHIDVSGNTRHFDN